MSQLITFPILLGVEVGGVVWSGYALTILWAWFIVPTFGLPALNLPAAIGFAIVAAYLTHQYMPKTKQEGGKWDEMLRVLAHTAFKPAFALVAGWIVKQWM